MTKFPFSVDVSLDLHVYECTTFQFNINILYITCKWLERYFSVFSGFLLKELLFADQKHGFHQSKALKSYRYF